MIDKNDLLPGHYLINVTLRPLPTRAELLAEKAFDKVCYSFDEGRRWVNVYRLDLRNRDVAAEPAGGETMCLIKHFGQSIISDRAIFWGDEERTPEAPEGWRPATALEAIVFAAAHPYFQRRFPIAALGSFTLSVDSRIVPVLGSGFDGRALESGPFNGRWREFYRFLFVSKKFPR